MRTGTALLLAAVLLVVPACGDGEGWAEAVERGCAEWNERFAHLEDRDLETAEDAVEHTGEVEQFAAGLLSVIEEAGTPEDAEQAGRLERAYRDLVEQTGALADATEARDGDAVAAATDRVSELGERINELAEDLGVPACGGY